MLDFGPERSGGPIMTSSSRAALNVQRRYYDLSTNRLMDALSSANRPDR